MNVPAAVKQRVVEDVKRYVAIAVKHYGRTFNTPRVEFTVRGARAGEAQGWHSVNFNPVLLMENLEDFIKETVPHEVAHCIDCALGNRDDVGIRTDRYGRIRRKKRSIHGDSWKVIMRLFGADPESRTHNYDVTNARVKTKNKFEYRCEGCDHRIFVSSVRHNKMQRGAVYWHKTCGQASGKLAFVQGLGQRTFTEARALSDARLKKIEDNKQFLREKYNWQPAAEAPPAEPQERVLFVSKYEYPVLKPHPAPQGNMAIAQQIMVKYGYNLTRQQFIVHAVEAGLKATTASTYYNQLKRKPQ